MSTWVLVGSVIRFPASNIDTVRGFGTQFELDDDYARELLPRASIMPLEEFEKIGFTTEELPRYAAPDAWADAPGAFKAKQRVTWAALEAYRNSAPSPVEKET